MNQRKWQRSIEANSLSHNRAWYQCIDKTLCLHRSSWLIREKTLVIVRIPNMLAKGGLLPLRTWSDWISIRRINLMSTHSPKFSCEGWTNDEILSCGPASCHISVWVLVDGSRPPGCRNWLLTSCWYFFSEATWRGQTASESASSDEKQNKTRIYLVSLPNYFHFVMLSPIFVSQVRV